MTDYSEDQLRFHHSRCHRNREDIQASQTAGCFHCLEIFPANEVTAYIGAPPSGDAHCPKCGIDSVIAKDGVNEFSPKLLQALHDEYFGKEMVLPASDTENDKQLLDSLSMQMQEAIAMLDTDHALGAAKTGNAHCK